MSPNSLYKGIFQSIQTVLTKANSAIFLFLFLNLGIYEFQITKILNQHPI